MIRLDLNDMQNMSFSELLETYFQLTEPSEKNKEVITKSVQCLNQMVNIGTYDEKGWVGICIYFANLRSFALEVIKLHAKNHHYETTYYEWIILAKYLPMDDPFRQEVVNTIKRIDKQQ